MLMFRISRASVGGLTSPLVSPPSHPSGCLQPHKEGPEGGNPLARSNLKSPYP